MYIESAVSKCKVLQLITAIAVHIIGKVREPFFHNTVFSGTGHDCAGTTEIKYKHTPQIPFYSCQRLNSGQRVKPINLPDRFG